MYNLIRFFKLIGSDLPYTSSKLKAFWYWIVYLLEFPSRRIKRITYRVVEEFLNEDCYSSYYYDRDVADFIADTFDLRVYQEYNDPYNQYIVKNVKFKGYPDMDEIFEILEKKTGKTHEQISEVITDEVIWDCSDITAGVYRCVITVEFDGEQSTAFTDIAVIR